MLSGQYPLRVVIFEPALGSKFNITYRSFSMNFSLFPVFALKLQLDSGPYTSIDGSFVKSPILGQPAWLLQIFSSSPAAWSNWYSTYLNPNQALKTWIDAHPEPWTKSRQETLGKNWMSKVFTGTHERVEDQKVKQNVYLW